MECEETKNIIRSWFYIDKAQKFEYIGGIKKMV